MSEIVEKLAAADQLSEEQVERIGETVHEFLKEASANPELMKETLEKLGFGERIMAHPIASRILKGMAIGGGSALGITGVHAGVTAMQDLKRDLKKARNYKAMLEATPELTGRGVDSKMVQRHFSTLHKFNPDYASDPMVAGTYVSNALEMARPSLDMINNMVRARKDIVSTRKELPGKRMAEAVSGAARNVAHAAEAARRAGEW